MIAEQQKPRAQGDFGKTPFLHILLYVSREALSGTLVVNRNGFETKVLFRNGKAVAARPLPRGTGLQDGLQELCGLSEAPFGFWDDDLIGDASGVTQGTVDPLPFAAEAVRHHARGAVMVQVIERCRGRRLRIAVDAESKRLGLHAPEARAFERLRIEAMTPEQFEVRVDLAPEEARRLLYLLLITGFALPEGGDLSSSSGVRAAINPPPGQPEIPSLRPSAAPPTDGASPVPPPQVDPRVPSSMPPRASEPGKPTSSMPAWQQLASMAADRRRSSQPSMRVPTPSMAPPPLETLDDIGKLRRAEQLVERRAFSEAGRIVDDLIRRDPDNPDYHATRSLILFQSFTGEKPPRALIEAIEATLSLKADHSRALYLKALVYKRMGRKSDAQRYFQRTLEVDPSHLEARRELRLAKMRRDK